MTQQKTKGKGMTMHFTEEENKSQCPYERYLTKAMKSKTIMRYLFFFLDFSLFISREEKAEGKRGREISMCGHLSRTPNQEPSPQPRHVPRLGIELATLWFTVQHSLHWATPARVWDTVLYLLLWQKLNLTKAKNMKSARYIRESVSHKLLVRI